MTKKLLFIILVALLLGFALIGLAVYLESNYTFSHAFFASFFQHLGLAICFPIIIGFIFEAVSRERILQFVRESFLSVIDHKQQFFRYGFETVEIGPDEQALRDLMFQETEASQNATFLFLRAGLILRVLLPVFRRVMDKGGSVRIISPEHDSAFVSSVVAGLKQCSQIARHSLPRIDTDEEIRKRDAEMEIDYGAYLGGENLKILKTSLYIPYGCLLLERQVHGRLEKVVYWFPFVVSKTCGYGPMFRVSDGAMLQILLEDVRLYVESARPAEFQAMAKKRPSSYNRPHENK